MEKESEGLRDTKGRVPGLLGIKRSYTGNDAQSNPPVEAGIGGCEQCAAPSPYHSPRRRTRSVESTPGFDIFRSSHDPRISFIDSESVQYQQSNLKKHDLYRKRLTRNTSMQRSKNKGIKMVVVNDNRFRVNGIIVDQEIQSGPKVNWTTIYQMMFQSGTPNGQRVALFLLIIVSISVTVAVLDSVESIRLRAGNFLLFLEILFTFIFSVEYLLRSLCLQKPQEYTFSFIGIIDIAALVPTYLGFMMESARPLVHLAVLRIFRVMRVFRILRLGRFVDAASTLHENLQSNKRRITVFLVGLFTMILVIGCAMYLIEGENTGFSNIPVSLYWTVVTITTVGYGDIAPVSIPGRMLATVVMFAGYGFIACPMMLAHSDTQETLSDSEQCPNCFRRFHQTDANFCRICGAALRSSQKCHEPIIHRRKLARSNLTSMHQEPTKDQMFPHVSDSEKEITIFSA